MPLNLDNLQDRPVAPSRVVSVLTISTIAERLILDAYKSEDRNIPDSDLDDEQPIALTVRMTLGELRKIRRDVAARERGAVGVAADLKARDDYDNSL